MTVKVVQGLIGIPKPAPKADQVTQSQALVRNAATVSVAGTIHATSSEAVSVSIKSKAAGAGERLKDSKDAKETADKVADNIRDNPESIDAHSLKSSAGSSHLN